MDGPRSFYKDRDALQELVESEKVAFVQAGDPINFHEDYHCKVNDSHYQLAHEFPISLIGFIHHLFNRRGIEFS